MGVAPVSGEAVAEGEVDLGVGDEVGVGTLLIGPSGLGEPSDEHV